MFFYDSLQFLEISFVSPNSMFRFNSSKTFTYFFGVLLQIFLKLLLIKELDVAFVPSMLIATKKTTF